MDSQVVIKYNENFPNYKPIYDVAEMITSGNFKILELRPESLISKKARIEKLDKLIKTLNGAGVEGIFKMVEVTK